MHRKQKHKEPRVGPNPAPQTYLTSVSSLFTHPSQLLYTLVDSEGHLQLFDIPTMSLVARSQLRLPEGSHILKCIYSREDCGVFYTLAQQQQAGGWGRHRYVLSMHCLARNGEIMWSTCPLRLEDRAQCGREYNEDADVMKYVFVDEPLAEKALPPNDPQNGHKLEEKEQQQEHQDEDIQFNELQEEQLRSHSAKYIRKEQPLQPQPDGPALQLKFTHFPPHNSLQQTQTAILECSMYFSQLPKHSSPYFTVITAESIALCTQQHKLVEMFVSGCSIACAVNVFGNVRLSALEEGAMGKQFRDAWLLFTDDACLFVEVPAPLSTDMVPESEEQQLPRIHSQLAVPLHQSYWHGRGYGGCTGKDSNKPVYDNVKMLCAVVTKESEVCLISYANPQCLAIVGRVRLDSLPMSVSNEMVNSQVGLVEKMNFVGLIRFGVNTSTTNKYEDKILLFISMNCQGCLPDVADPGKQKREQKQDQRQEQKSKQNPDPIEDESLKPKQPPKEKPKQTAELFVYCFEMGHSNPNTHGSSLSIYNQVPCMNSGLESRELVTVARDFPAYRRIWYNEYLENKVQCLSQGDEVQMVDMGRFVENRNIGKQWVNLGYRFEALDSNELYEELEDEFELTAEESTSGLRLNDLDDWSYCLLPRETVVANKLKRLNFYQF